MKSAKDEAAYSTVCITGADEVRQRYLRRENAFFLSFFLYIFVYGKIGEIGAKDLIFHYNYVIMLVTPVYFTRTERPCVHERAAGSAFFTLCAELFDTAYAIGKDEIWTNIKALWRSVFSFSISSSGACEFLR